MILHSLSFLGLRGWGLGAGLTTFLIGAGWGTGLGSGLGTGVGAGVGFLTGAFLTVTGLTTTGLGLGWTLKGGTKGFLTTLGAGFYAG